LPTPAPDSGIKIAIAGAGIGGLAFAIESRLQGHTCVLFDSVSAWREHGDSIGLFANSSRLVYRWGIDPALKKHCGNAMGFATHRYRDGKVLLEQFPPKGFKFPKESPLYDTTRSGLHEVMVATAEALGCKIHLGHRIQQYEETEKGATIITPDGTRYDADIVVASDGFNSRAKKSVLGYEDLPRHSGYAIYRAYFDASHIKGNPICGHLVNDDGNDKRTCYIGPDIHFISTTLKGTKDFNWVMTHKDEKGIEESWSLPGKIEDALEVVKDWDEVVKEVIRCTPADRLFDWKLVYRDAYPSWCSAKGNICLLGDAAHPFIPTSQQGASQAVEDGACLARCLTLAKKHGHSTRVATNTYQRLRYDRVRKAQQLGVSNREMWHKTDIDSDDFDPESIRLKHDPWLMEHDESKHTMENYEKVAGEFVASGL